MRLLICFCFLILFQSCSEHVEDEYFPLQPIHFPAPNKMYERDSFYLAYTIKQFNDLRVVGYGLPLTRIDIDTVVYSSDTLKLFALVIDYCDYSAKGLSYNGQAVLGYRLKIIDPWIVYPVRCIFFVGYKNYNMVRDRLRSAYFINFDYPMSGVWNYRDKKFETYRSYNVVDKKFWDSSFIWQKDVSIPGIYDFQLSGNGNPEMPHPILEIPAITYPDSLLKLYHANKW